MSNKIGAWPENTWLNIQHMLMLGIIDFRRVPGFMQVSKHNAQRPYFEDFTNALQKQSQAHNKQASNLALDMWVEGRRDSGRNFRAEVHLHRGVLYSLLGLLALK